MFVYTQDDIYPLLPSKDRLVDVQDGLAREAEGLVFTINEGDHERIWSR
jgi:hypothetical protein